MNKTRIFGCGIIVGLLIALAAMELGRRVLGPMIYSAPVMHQVSCRFGWLPDGAGDCIRENFNRI